MKLKGSQTMEFGQLIEYNIRNIFIEKSYTKYGGETILRSFFHINSLKFYTVCFYGMPS